MTRLRPITDADIDAVAEVHVRTWQSAYAGIVPDDYLAALDPAVFAERRRGNPLPGARTMVTEDGGLVTGFVTFGPDRTEPAHGELYAIYVRPESQGAGAGRLLLRAAKDGLTADGLPDMRLWVLEANHRARRFYERRGLEPDGTRHYYTPRGTTVELPELRYATAL